MSLQFCECTASELTVPWAGKGPHTLKKKGKLWIFGPPEPKKDMPTPYSNLIDRTGGRGRKPRPRFCPLFWNTWAWWSRVLVWPWRPKYLKLTVILRDIGRLWALGGRLEIRKSQHDVLAGKFLFILPQAFWISPEASNYPFMSWDENADPVLDLFSH